MSLGGIVFGYCAEPKERAGRCLHLNTNRLRVQTLYSLVVNLLSSLKKKKKGSYFASSDISVRPSTNGTLAIPDSTK